MRNVLVYLCPKQYLEECISVVNEGSFENEEIYVVDIVESKKTSFLKNIGA